MFISRKQILEAFFVQVLNLVIFSTAFFIIHWALQSSFDISKVDISSFNNFVIFCFSAVVRSSLFPYVSIYIIDKKKKSFL